MRGHKKNSFIPRHMRNAMRGARPSQTPGKSKGSTCQADTRKKFFARNAKSYKHPGYGEWCKKMDAENKISRA